MFDNELLHPFDYSGPLPKRLNNPLDYSVHPVCVAAVENLKPHIESLMGDSNEGKMFGVLVTVDSDNRLSYLAAFSGQIFDKSVVPGFVPPVFDLLSPDGYFKVHEREISEINTKISMAECSVEYLAAKKHLEEDLLAAEMAVGKAKAEMDKAKERRDSVRAVREISDEEKSEFIKESQFLKAELKRIKRAEAEIVGKSKEELSRLESEIEKLKDERQKKSENLQRWIFEQYVLQNHKGERKSIFEIFDDAFAGLPPAGTGDCCEPKLLQYAYQHNLKPLQMAMFWWGKSFGSEQRLHLKFYQACSSKCKPLLQFMLPKSVLRRGYLKSILRPEILYEDADLWVVDKPSGLLSVPGNSDDESVISILQKRCSDNETALEVHRLDRDTCGVMIVAKNLVSQAKIRKEFENREVKKTYFAVLEGNPLEVGASGVIDLPLSADYENRPSQRVDRVGGKTAITKYLVVGEHVVQLHPLTGRTHQLRVHCAHPDGFGRPIRGDRLYGNKGGRLQLFAARIEFSHPASGEQLVVESARFKREKDKNCIFAGLNQ